MFTNVIFNFQFNHLSVQRISSTVTLILRFRLSKFMAQHVLSTGAPHSELPRLSRVIYLLNLSSNNQKFQNHTVMNQGYTLGGVKLPILKSSTNQQSLPLTEGEHYRAEGWVSLSINPVFLFFLIA